MKLTIKRSVFAAFLLLTSASLLACQSEGAYSLKRGVNKSVDVLGHDLVEFTFRADSFSSPKAKVTAEHIGFECEIVELEKLYSKKGKTCYKLSVSWSPGADVSGCEVQVKTKSNKRAFLAELYMNY